MPLPLNDGPADGVVSMLELAAACRDGARWSWDPQAAAFIIEGPNGLLGALAPSRLAAIIPELDVQRQLRAVRALLEDVSDAFTLDSTIVLGGEPTRIVIRGRRDISAGTSRVVGTIENRNAPRAPSGQTLLDLMPANVAVLDERGRITATNAHWLAFARDAGVERDWIGVDYLAPCIAAAQDEPLVAEVAEGLVDLLAGARSELTVDYPCHHAHERRWFRLRASAANGADGRQVVVQHEDITEIVVARLEAERRGAAASATQRAVRAGGFEEHADGRIEASRELLTMLRRERVDRFGEIVSTLPASDRRAFSEARRIAWHGEQSSMEHGLQGTAARTIFLPVLVDGVVIAVRGMVHANSDPQQVRALREQLSSMTESMSECVCTIDGAGRIIDVNAAAARVLRYRRAELIGRDLVEAIVAPADAATGSSVLAGALSATSNTTASDRLFVRRDGVAVPVSYVVSHYRESDGPRATIVFSDISEQKERERIRDEQVARDKWTRRVRDALRDDRFVLWAQPIIDLASGDTVQHELLIRMRGKDGGLLGPASFLPAAEASGLIRDVDSWVVRQATALAARGHPVHVNLSAESICHEDTTRIVEQAIVASGADPSLIVIELTETAVLKDERAARNFATRTVGLGIRLALDDFGTGYGGFTYLKHLPISSLKIDREFVRDLDTSEASRHVVEATVQLARSFGIETIAEGVETALVLDRLRTCGIDLAQGYLFSRPRPLNEVFS